MTQTPPASPNEPHQPPATPGGGPPPAQPPSPPLPPGAGAAPAGRPPGARPTTSALAIVSLVASLLPCIPLVGPLVAIVCGHMALGQIKRSEGKVGGRGMALAGTVLGYAGLVLQLLVVALLVFLAPAAFHEARSEAYQARGAADLHQIGNALHMYAAMRENRLPDSLDALVAEQLVPPEMLVEVDMPRYVYCKPAAAFLDQVPPGTPLVWDNPACAPYEGVNVLFADGHIETWDAPPE